MSNKKSGAFSLSTNNIDDVGQKRGFSWFIPQWGKNDFKSMNYTNGDYFFTLRKLEPWLGNTDLDILKTRHGWL